MTTTRQSLRRAAGAKVFERNPGLNAWGKYLCEVVKLKGAGRLRPYFIAEVLVLDVKPLKDEKAMAALPLIERPNAAGSKAAIKVPMDQEWSGGAMLACLMAITGDPQSAFGDETPEGQQAGGDYIDELTDEVRNPCKGLQFIVEVTKVPAKGEQNKPDPRLVFAKNYTHVGDPLGKNKAWLEEVDKQISADASKPAAGVPAP